VDARHKAGHDEVGHFTFNRLDSLLILIRLVLPATLKDFAAETWLVDRTQT
jgi:hypothetical protein